MIYPLLTVDANLKHIKHIIDSFNRQREIQFIRYSRISRMT